ncbi:sugar phosphate nucleotidyltransferase [Halopelagius longus]|uniref:Glucose-1-phosphate thymidylyltransferase n=1 Tax=Halopelagius longus TaxID=1236180 RepID=A0A1H1ANF2_9EURY|nr:sugar phosphate nucleotidyltransferase [Halopelagius longus]RDI70452.1 dTDP-glucose pyrophosphorylase [Halopelagius longus]SDQ41150.1 glucose-1-phosphate thymidylyltransferase [Halopelagius longus]
MKAIIPAAGQGTRLYPQTHTKPKAMVRLAGKPILGHILDSIGETRIDEVVIVVGGPMKEQIIEYVNRAYGDRFEFEFVEQENAEGLGHSIYQTESVARGDELLIALGDMLFENGFDHFLSDHDELPATDGSIGVKRVDEPQHYGVVETRNGGEVTRLVEKPSDPPSEYAISGVYIIENSDALFDALDYLVENDVRGAGDEYQLTDALQRMIEQGRTLYPFEVEDWYDCGRPDTLLEANRVLLSRTETADPESIDSAVIIPPVDLGNDIEIEESVVGPYVSVDDGAKISKSIVDDSIVGQKAVLDGVNIEESIVGSNTEVHGEANHLNVGDNSSIHL